MGSLLQLSPRVGMPAVSRPDTCRSVLAIHTRRPPPGAIRAPEPHSAAPLPEPKQGLKTHEATEAHHAAESVERCRTARARDEVRWRRVHPCPT